MSRLNIEDSLFNDPRFCIIIDKIGRPTAIGYWVMIAKIAQEYWARGKQLIPKNLYEMNQFPEIFVKVGLLQVVDDAYYLSGSEENFAWLLAQRENGRKGGRPSKINNIEKPNDNPNVTRRNPPTPTPTPTLNTNTPEKKSDDLFFLAVADIWDSYAEREYLTNSPGRKTLAFKKIYNAAKKWFKDYPKIEQWEKIIRVAVKQKNETTGWVPDFHHIFRNVNPEKYLAEFEKNERLREL